MRRSSRVAAFGILAFCLVLFAQHVAHAVTPTKSVPDAPQVSLEITPTHRFTMEVPTGLCRVDPKGSERERILISVFARQSGRLAKLLVMFAECHALKAFRAGGHNLTLDRWGGALAPLIDGKLRPLPGVNRREVVEQIGRGFALGETEEDVRAQDEVANRAIASGLKEAKSKNSAKVNFQRSVGLLAQDDIAAFSGSLARETVNGKSRMVSGVWGVTLVGEHLLLVSFWRPFVNRGTFDTLVSETRDALRDLILRNDRDSFRAP